MLWGFAQSSWLLPAYMLEFKGNNTFLFIWLEGLAFFCANVGILAKMIRRYREQSLEIEEQCNLRKMDWEGRHTKFTFPSISVLLIIRSFDLNLVILCCANINTSKPFNKVFQKNEICISAKLNQASVLPEKLFILFESKLGKCQSRHQQNCSGYVKIKLNSTHEYIYLRLYRFKLLTRLRVLWWWPELGSALPVEFLTSDLLTREYTLTYRSTIYPIQRQYLKLTILSKYQPSAWINLHLYFDLKEEPPAI